MRDNVSRLFSNRGRWLKMGLPAAALIALCIYSAIAGPNLAPRFSDYLKDPARFDGTRMMVQFTQVDSYDGPGKFTVRDIKGSRIAVMGAIPPGQESCFISFDAVFRSPGHLVLGDKWHIYARDTLKLIVSAVALVGVAAFFLRRFRFNLRRFRFEERP